MFQIEDNLDELIAALDDYEARVLPNVYTIVMLTTAKEFFVRVVIFTPRDTGYAQFSWDANLSTVGEFLPTPGRGPYSPANIDRVMKLKDEIKLGDTIVVYSNAPYMNRLNNGWSQKAPTDFIGRALAQAQDAVANALG